MRSEPRGKTESFADLKEHAMTDECAGTETDTTADEPSEASATAIAATVDDIAPLAELRALADRALAEITAPGDVGEFVSAQMEADSVAKLSYAVRVPGYADWFWTVLLTRVDGAEATVLECCMLPGEDALLAPPWVPWEERLAEFRATHDRRGNPLPQADDEQAEETGDQPRERVRTMTRTRVRRRRRRDREAESSETADHDVAVDAEGDSSSD